MKNLKPLFTLTFISCFLALSPAKIFAQKTDSPQAKPKVDSTDLGAFFSRVNAYQNKKSQREFAAKTALSTYTISASPLINNVRNAAATAQSPTATQAEKDAALLNAFTSKMAYLREEQIQINQKESAAIMNDQAKNSASQAANANAQSKRLDDAAKTQILRVQP